MHNNQRHVDKPAGLFSDRPCTVTVTLARSTVEPTLIGSWLPQKTGGHNGYADKIKVKMKVEHLT